MSQIEHQDSQMTDVANVHEEQHDSQMTDAVDDVGHQLGIGADKQHIIYKNKDQQADLPDIYGGSDDDNEDRDDDVGDDDHYSGWTDNHSENDYGQAEWLDHTDDMADDGEQFEFKYIERFTNPISAQEQSGLMSLPEELLNQIYQYVFTDEEGNRPYDFDTCYRRPGYFAPRITHTSFLRSCQVVYRNAWFMPWTLSRKTIYLAWQSRKPDHSTTPKDIRKYCEFIQGIRKDVEVGAVQVFAQQCNLSTFPKIMDIENFRPREVVLTIRHTDFWNWEDDADLSFDIGSILDVEFPESVRRFVIELESLSRKKEAVEDMLKGLGSYSFLRTGGGSFKAGQMSNETWEGSSTWEDERWVRDEEDEKPGKLTYYIGRRIFVPSRKQRGELEGDHWQVGVDDGISEKVRYKGPTLYGSQIRIEDLKLLGGLNGRRHHEVPASEIIRLMNDIVE